MLLVLPGQPRYRMITVMRWYLVLAQIFGTVGPLFAATRRCFPEGKKYTTSRCFVFHHSLAAVGIKLCLSWSMIQFVVPPKMFGDRKFRKLFILFFGLFAVDLTVIVLQACSTLLFGYRGSKFNDMLTIVSLGILPIFHVACSYQLLDS